MKFKVIIFIDYTREFQSNSLLINIYFVCNNIPESHSDTAMHVSSIILLDKINQFAQDLYSLNNMYFI